MTRTNRQEAVQGRIGRLTHARLARAIGVAAVLILMMMLFVTTGSAQYAEQGAIRLSAGQLAET